MQQNGHRRLSAIWQNNTRAGGVDLGSSSFTAAPFMYDAVLKEGIVNYLFMNKGESPCEVEIVVFRIKKNGVQAAPTDFNSVSLSQQLETPIGDGMMRKILGGISTDRCPSGSHVPSATDWVSDPSRPFLPKNRFIDQALTPYTEVNRVKLVLQSGQRRPFQLKLGGIQYDPSKSVLAGPVSPKMKPILDEHSYIVCIALNGIAMSRQLGGIAGGSGATRLTNGPIIGDVYASADLQWYSEYTEHVGAMSYKKVRSRNLFSFGAAPTMQSAINAHNQVATATQKVTSTPVAMLTQAQAVRLPQTTTQIKDSSGAYSVSTQETQAAVGGTTEIP